MPHVMEFPDSCLERLRPHHVSAIALQYGHQLLGIQCCHVTLGAMESCPGRVPSLLLHHDREAPVQSRASHSKMQHVTASSRSCLELSHSPRHSVIAVRRGAHPGSHICLVALGATEFLPGSSPRSSSHHDRGGPV